MASIYSYSPGWYCVQFVGLDGKRRTLRLGKCDRKTAEAIRRHVEALLAAQFGGLPVSRDTASWLGGISDKLRRRLARVGLIDTSSTSLTLGQFLAEYINQRPDLAPKSVLALQQAAKQIAAVLGADTKLAQVSPADADRFKAYLLNRGQARATVAKLIRYAKQVFNAAVRQKRIAENPFAHLTGQGQTNRTRQRFVTADEVRRVLEVISCPYLRALVVLARWGGLRIPSEALALRWSDVNWEKGLFIVRASKTAHHASGGIRIVPLFPEVRAVLDELWQLAPEGEDRILARTPASATARLQLQKACQLAGLQPWPKLFHNLRASRATELADQYPSHVCAAWLGHTERIADAFYRQVTDEHIRRATGQLSQHSKSDAKSDAVKDGNR